jgi:hypothetical protein
VLGDSCAVDSFDGCLPNHRADGRVGQGLRLFEPGMRLEVCVVMKFSRLAQSTVFVFTVTGSLVARAQAPESAPTPAPAPGVPAPKAVRVTLGFEPFATLPRHHDVGGSVGLRLFARHEISADLRLNTRDEFAWGGEYRFLLPVVDGGDGEGYWIRPLLVAGYTQREATGKPLIDWTSHHVNGGVGGRFTLNDNRPVPGIFFEVDILADRGVSGRDQGVWRAGYLSRVGMAF